jgi:hypothetical protein
MRKIQDKDVANLEKKLASVMERILIRQKKKAWCLAVIRSSLSQASSVATAQGNGAPRLTTVQSFSTTSSSSDLITHKKHNSSSSWLSSTWSKLTGASSSSSGKGLSKLDGLNAHRGSFSGGASGAGGGSLSAHNLPALRSECSALTSELRQLDEVRRALFLEVHDLRLGRSALLASSTCQGRFFNLLGYFFSVCEWRHHTMV